jgi:hypothetical protein
MPRPPLRQSQKNWILRFALLGVVGVIAFVIGIDPALIGMNITPGIGVTQMSLWLAGLGAVLIGGFAAVRIVRNGRPNSLRADIGMRMIATGYVFSAVASLADYLGIGTQHFPKLSFGTVQIIGLIFGIAVSLIGLIIYWPWGKEPEPEDA